MSRSKWKGVFLDFFLLKKNIYRKNIKIWSRRSTILPYLVGKKVSVYNGQKFVYITINAEKVGLKLGEFSYTRNHLNYRKYSKKYLKKDLKKKVWVSKRI